jgi:hypothetical protein
MRSGKFWFLLLEKKVLVIMSPTYSKRLQYYSSGIFDLLIPIILQTTNSNQTLENAWRIVGCAMCVPDVKELDNIETIGKGVELGFIELAVRELKFRPLRYDGKLMYSASLALANSAPYANFTNQLISAGAPLACLEYIRDAGNTIENETTRRNLTAAMTTLNNIARFNVNCVQSLPGVIEVVKPFLPLLRRENNYDMVVFGFTAGRLLIRLYGKENSSKIISENPVIVEFYPLFMRKIMNVGAAQSYYLYNTYWVLAGVMLDLSLISTSTSSGDTTNNKHQQLLIPLIPLVLEMMACHHNGDCDVLRFGMIFLSQISSNKSCLAEVKKYLEILLIIQDIILSGVEFDKEIVCLLGEIVCKVMI